MLERTNASYPMLRRRRRGPLARSAAAIRQRRRPLAFLVLVAALAAAALVWRAMPERLEPAQAPALLATAERALAEGNYSAARHNAQRATAADPSLARAHVVLARAALALEDGLVAEAALGRARAAGADPARLHHLLGWAALLQGDTARALAETERASPADVAEGSAVRARALAVNGDLPAARALVRARLGDEPSDARGWTTLGRLRFETGDVGGADAAVARALRIDRQLPEALVLKGEVVRSRYGLVAALPWFDAALARDRYYPPALRAKAATLGDAGRYRAMLAATRDVLAARPGDPTAMYLQAVLAARAGRLDLARSLLARAGPEVASQPGGLLLGGVLDYTAGRYEGAIGQWQDLLDQQPMNLSARRLLGAAMLRSGDARGALKVLRPLAIRADADPYTLTLAARGFEATGERGWANRMLARAAAPANGASAPFGTDDSLPLLAGAAAQAANDPGAAVGLIRGHLENGNAAAAIARARALVTASPGAPAAQLLLGDALVAAGRYREAVAPYARASALRFDEPAMLRLIDTLDRTGDDDGAARVLALYLVQNPRSVAGARLLATRQLAAREWPAAIETLEALRHRVGSGDAILLAGLARAYAGAGDGAVARRYGRAAYRLAPGKAAAGDAYGWALYAAGQPNDAVQLLTKAAALAPRDAGVRWRLAQALAEANRSAEARAAITAALSDPRFPDRAAAVALRDLLAR